MAFAVGDLKSTTVTNNESLPFHYSTPKPLDLLPLPKRPFLLIGSLLIHHNHLLEPLPQRFGVRTDQTIAPSHLRLLILDKHVRTLAADGVFVTEDENGVVYVEEAVDVFGSAIGDRGAA